MRVVVTGANKGLGLGLVRAFAERGDEVVAVCRQKGEDLPQLDVRIVEGVDVTDDRAVAQCAAEISWPRIDVLICNAGVNHDAPRFSDVVIEDLKLMFDVNTLGAVRVVAALLPFFRRGSKIALIGSGGLSSLNLKAPDTVHYGYRMSKAALVSLGNGLGRELRPLGISVGIFSPGRVDTPLLRRIFEEGRTTDAAINNARAAYEVGRLLRDRIDALTLDRSPTWERTPFGDPAIPAELYEQIEG